MTKKYEIEVLSHVGGPLMEHRIDKEGWRLWKDQEAGNMLRLLNDHNLLALSVGDFEEARTSPYTLRGGKPLPAQVLGIKTPCTLTLVEVELLHALCSYSKKVWFTVRPLTVYQGEEDMLSLVLIAKRSMWDNASKLLPVEMERLQSNKATPPEYDEFNAALDYSMETFLTTHLEGGRVKWSYLIPSINFLLECPGDERSQNALKFVYSKIGEALVKAAEAYENKDLTSEVIEGLARSVVGNVACCIMRYAMRNEVASMRYRTREQRKSLALEMLEDKSRELTGSVQTSLALGDECATLDQWSERLANLSILPTDISRLLPV